MNAVPKPTNPLTSWFHNLQGHLPRDHRHRGATPIQMLQRLKPGTNEDMARAWLDGQVPILGPTLNEIIAALNPLLRSLKLTPVTTAQYHRGENQAVPRAKQSTPQAVPATRPMLGSGFTTRRVVPLRPAATAAPVVTTASRPVAVKPKRAPRQSKYGPTVPCDPRRIELVRRRKGLTVKALCAAAGLPCPMYDKDLEHRLVRISLLPSLELSEAAANTTLNAAEELERQALRHSAKATRVKATKLPRPKKEKVAKPPQDRHAPRRSKYGPGVRCKKARIELARRRKGLTVAQMCLAAKLPVPVYDNNLGRDITRLSVLQVIDLTEAQANVELDEKEQQELENLRHPPKPVKVKAVKVVKPKQEKPPKASHVSVAAQRALASVAGDEASPDAELLVEFTDLFRRLGNKGVRALLRSRDALRKVGLPELTDRDRELAAAILLG